MQGEGASEDSDRGVDGGVNRGANGGFMGCVNRIVVARAPHAGRRLAGAFG